MWREHIAIKLSRRPPESEPGYNTHNELLDIDIIHACMYVCISVFSLSLSLARALSLTWRQSLSTEIITILNELITKSYTHIHTHDFVVPCGGPDPNHQTATTHTHVYTDTTHTHTHTHIHVVVRVHVYVRIFPCYLQKRPEGRAGRGQQRRRSDWRL
jgi:hypothetical protein